MDNSTNPGLSGMKYEPPRAVRLSDTRVGVGSVCRDGGTPAAACSTGTYAQGSCQPFGYYASPSCHTLGDVAVPTCNVGTGVPV